MSVEKVVIGNATLYHGDCREVLPTLDPVDCVIADPPYFKVKDDYWDNEWDNPRAFLAWMRDIVGLLAAAMRPSASLYLFASPQMAGRVEAAIWDRLNVLTHAVWRKGAYGLKASTRANRSEKEALRAYFSTTERVIFAEHYNSDNFARGESNYVQKCDELRGFVFEPLRAYLAAEFAALGWNPEKLNEICGTASMAGRHYIARSQWCLPTESHYARLQAAANVHLRREYEDLRREYEDLRREYEDLRRPFALDASSQWSDIWDFEPVASYAGKHSCEKPQALLLHMLHASTRPGSLVLDPFLGSGATAIACNTMGLRFVGIERDAGHFAAACRRIEDAQRQASLFPEVFKAKAAEQMALIA